jgi:hypothetical protein
MSRCCHPLKACLVVLALLLLTPSCTTSDEQGPLFQDDFNSQGSGWGVAQRDESERGYEQDKYFVELHEPNWFAWAYPGLEFDDVSLEIDVYLDSDSPDGHFGALCRHTDVDNFYYFSISADGYYAIFRRVDGGDLEVLTGDGTGMLPSPTIKTSGDANHLLAVCRGDELSLFVNGELLETVTDDVHARGDVGLGAGSGPDGSFRVLFDDLVVAVP